MAKKKKRRAFSNVSNDTPLTINQMQQLLADLTGGAVVVVRGRLVGLREGRLIELSTQEKLFAFINPYADVIWQSRKGLSKDVFFEGLRQQADAYDFVSEQPHFSRVPTAAYLCEEVVPAANGAVEEFIDFFAPASDLDRQLMLAAFLTLFWGGPPGARPAFVLTSDLGRGGVGIGKTTFAQKLTAPVGGHVLITAKVQDEKVGTLLLSPQGLRRRTVLIDNVKGARLSSMGIEAAITSREVGGHRLYEGYDSRPNYVTWFITVNEAKFSKDLADRSVVMNLASPKRRAGWEKAVDDFIAENRVRLFADVASYFELPATNIGGDWRWTEWTTEVLSRVGGTDETVAAIHARASAVDDEQAVAKEFVDFIRDALTEMGNSVKELNNYYVSSAGLKKWCKEFDPAFDGEASQFLRKIGATSWFEPKRDSTERGFRFKPNGNAVRRPD
jgi:hypothetical protein